MDSVSRFHVAALRFMRKRFVIETVCGLAVAFPLGVVKLAWRPFGWEPLPYICLGILLALLLRRWLNYRIKYP